MKLWVVGCSFAHGVGVVKNQSWGSIVAEQLSTPVEFLTAPGSSIEWAADQILRADIKPPDVVLWGITSPNRYTYYNELGKVQHLLPVYYNNNPKFERVISSNRLADTNLAYKAVNYVKQVENYLSKIGCNYSMGYFISGLLEHRNIILSHFKENKKFFIAFDEDQIPTGRPSLPNESLLKFVDVGSDGIHPGPKQHKIYAEMFLKNLKQS